nr:hypothetical protein Iba_chr06fCG5530 [Ipomoea batatas]
MGKTMYAWAFFLVASIELHIYLMFHAFFQVQNLISQKIVVNSWIYLSWTAFIRRVPTMFTCASLRPLMLLKDYPQRGLF